MLIKSSKCPEYNGTNAIPITLLLRDWVGATTAPQQSEVVLRWRDANYTRFSDAMVAALSKVLTPDGVKSMNAFIRRLSSMYSKEHIISTYIPSVYKVQSRPIVSNGKKLARFSYAKRTPSRGDATPDYKGKHEEYLVLRTSTWEKP